MSRPVAEFCKHGHRIAVCGRVSNGQCRACYYARNRNYSAEYRDRQAAKLGKRQKEPMDRDTLPVTPLVAFVRVGRDRLGSGLLDAFAMSCARGRVTVRLADEVCTALGYHPAEIYAEDWWNGSLARADPGGDGMKRAPIARKRTKPRRTVMPRCSNRQCHAIARIEGLCTAHAEQLADRLFSEWVRKRDHHGCTVWFWEVVSGDCEGPVQAAHGEPRGNHATRYDKRNVHAVCRKHHFLLDRGSKHALKAEWLRSILGDDGYLELLGYALVPTKRAAAIEDALAWLRPVEVRA